MKKAVISVIAVLLIVCIASCNSISKEKKQQIDDAVKAYEDAVFEVGKQLEELAEYQDKIKDYETIFSYYDEKFMELVTLKQALKEEYDKKIDSFNEESADAYLAQFEDPMKKAEKYLEEITYYINYLEEN